MRLINQLATISYRYREMNLEGLLGAAIGVKVATDFFEILITRQTM